MGGIHKHLGALQEDPAAWETGLARMLRKLNRVITVDRFSLERETFADPDYFKQRTKAVKDDLSAFLKDLSAKVDDLASVALPTDEPASGEKAQDGAAASGKAPTNSAGGQAEPQKSRCVRSELTSYWPDPDFLEAAADEVHALFFPPAPPANMERFKQMVSDAIDKKNRHDASEAEMERKIADHYEKIKQDRRLRDKKAGPPKKGWLWVEGFFKDFETEPLDGWAPPKMVARMEHKGWVWDDPIPVWGNLQPTPPDIILPGQYVILAIVHDNSDEATNRGRPRLLDGFTTLLPIFGMMRDYGPCTSNEMRMSGFDRRSIERALQDVKADLALVEAQATTGARTDVQQAADLKEGHVAPCPVVLGDADDPPTVCGREKEPLGVTAYNVVNALVKAYPKGLVKAHLERKADCADPQKALARLRTKDADWKAAIFMPGTAGRGGYRLKPV